MTFLLYMWAAWRAYRLAKRYGTSFVAVTDLGMPQIAIFVGIGREAWRISRRAVDEFE